MLTHYNYSRCLTANVHQDARTNSVVVLKRPQQIRYENENYLGNPINLYQHCIETLSWFIFFSPWNEIENGWKYSFVSFIDSPLWRICMGARNDDETVRAFVPLARFRGYFHCTTFLVLHVFTTSIINVWNDYVSVVLGEIRPYYTAPSGRIINDERPLSRKKKF